jgi:hypothetical protein
MVQYTCEQIAHQAGGDGQRQPHAPSAAARAVVPVADGRSARQSQLPVYGTPHAVVFKIELDQDLDSQRCRRKSAAKFLQQGCGRSRAQGFTTQVGGAPHMVDSDSRRP